MNEKTLISFIVTGLRKNHIKELPLIFVRGVKQLLAFENIPADTIEDLVRHYTEIEYTKTHNKSLLGNMNDLVDRYKFMIWYRGGLARCDLNTIIADMNRMPQRNLKWADSMKAVRELLVHGE